ncbi:hypothetical protein O0235_07865 [Tepidiforma flava]|uniref:Uncharacterized protein n=1 Tax=Tepidiforma flava TaxID=3004094 RepID=A0ABY7M4Z9_9CHLR|nr:hypothetical protein [Tepidiforma flava]WBL34713.1 hypothetical protein O0235_07865 [Tepidiforma flava]
MKVKRWGAGAAAPAGRLDLLVHTGLIYPIPRRSNPIGETEVLYFVLQPNETGQTGSHQTGEVHVRREQVGEFLPHLRHFGKETHNRVFWAFHAQRAEWGQVTYTCFGARYTPEERLRRFPPTWRSEFVAGRVLVLVAMGPVAILYLLDPVNPDSWPPGLIEVCKVVRDNGRTFGRVRVTGPDFVPADWLIAHLFALR